MCMNIRICQGGSQLYFYFLVHVLLGFFVEHLKFGFYLCFLGTKYICVLSCHVTSRKYSFHLIRFKIVLKW